MFNLPINLLEDPRLNVSERSLQPLRFMQVAQLRAELAMSRASEAGHLGNHGIYHAMRGFSAPLRQFCFGGFLVHAT